MLRPALTVIIVAALLAAPATAGAVGLPGGYPRTIAGVGTADGVTVSRTQATIRLVSGSRVQVTVFATATTAAAGRRLVLAVSRCTGSASSPTCRATASTRVSLASGRTALQRTFTMGRPAAPPDALRVMVMVTRSASAPVPLCSAGTRPGAACKGDSRFVLGGDLILSGGTWRARQGTGTRFGTLAGVPPGVALDLVFFNSRTYAWTATSRVATTVTTTIGYPNQPPARTFTDRLAAGVRRAFDRTPSVGTGFETRAGIRTLRYEATADGATWFSLQVPVPAWTNNG